MGETFSPNDFTGTAGFSIPIPLPPCRDIGPSLSLSYSSGGGNGEFGMGFDLATLRISRRTSRHIPRYDNSDEYVLGADVLVPAYVQSGEQWVPDVGTQTLDGVDYTVAAYRPRTDGGFSLIERWLRQSDNDVHWRLRDTGNRLTLFGFTDQARITDPADASRVFSWLAETVTNNKGDTLDYVYKAEDGIGAAVSQSEVNRSVTAQKYLSRITYGAYSSAVSAPQAFTIILNYGEFDPSPANATPFTPVGPWACRPDPFSLYGSGFEIRTFRRCLNILIFNNFTELGAIPTLTAMMDFGYTLQSGLSFLQTATHYGYQLQRDGTYVRTQTPAISLVYQAYEPAQQIFQPIVLAGGGKLPGPVDGDSLMLVDLYGDGLPGLLHTRPDGCRYWSNRGGAVFSPPSAPAVMPIERSLGRQTANSLTSLDGGGLPDLVVERADRAGFYGNAGNGNWQSFTPFSRYTVSALLPGRQLVDIDGDGRSDLLFFVEEGVRYNLTLGREGYGPSVQCARPASLPTPDSAAPNEVVRFGDLFGDGGDHLIRIRDGQVQCWPNLGYGVFGAVVAFDNAPIFPGGLDPSRLLLIDCDGSGMLDLVYLDGGQLLIYGNLSGDGFAPPVAMPLPTTYGALDRIAFGDILGIGSTALVLSIGSGPPQHVYIDFTGGQKPYLLTGINNNTGVTTAITYGSSTQFALDDALNGTPWPVPLPHAVQVVTQVEVADAISGGRAIRSFAYHDGYFDRGDREFAGFGYVESWEGDSFEAQSYAPPRYARRWYHTGASYAAGILSAQYQSEYFSGDPLAYAMPDSVFSDMPSPVPGPALVQGYRALRGQMLREEVYGQDATSQAVLPYTVMEKNFTVACLQPPVAAISAAFTVQPRENITYTYERDSDDPRIQHDFTFAVDDWGIPLQVCTVFYARRANPAISPPQQSPALVAIVTTPATPSDGSYLHDQIGQKQRYQLGNLVPSGGALYFNFAGLSAGLTTALENVLFPEQSFSGTVPQARTLSWQQTIFWNSGQSAALPVGQVVSPPLVCNAAQAVLTPGLVTEVFGQVLTPAMIGTDGGYVAASGYWWDPGPVCGYAGADQFYLPQTLTDQFGAVSQVAYDDYALLPVSAVNSDGTTTAGNDYQVLQPWTVTDVNNVVTQILFDPLGQPVVSTVFHPVTGAPSQGDGPVSGYALGSDPDTAAVVANPAAYLQQMTSFFFYDLSCWTAATPQPPHVVSVTRTIHASDLPPSAATPLRLKIDYFDGFGRPLQTRLMMDGAVTGSVAPLWLTSGTVVYDDKGNIVQRYRPTFQTDYPYGIDTSTPFDRFYFDALNRPVKTVTAKGFYTQTIYSAWSKAAYDADDTILSSTYYQQNIGNTSPDFADQLDALKKAAIFNGTPTTSLLNPQGQEVELQRINLSSAAPTPVIYPTLYGLDVDGNVLTVTDPRFVGAVPAIYTFDNIYDMRGAAIGTTGIDNGSHQTFLDVFGQPVSVWDGRGVQVTRQYDSLRRLTGVQVTGLGMNSQPVEIYTYGTSADLNQIGRLVTQQDEAGILTLSGYTIEGRAGQQSRAVRQNYQVEVDWGGTAPPLDPPLSVTSIFDIDGNVLSSTAPDGTVTTQSYFSGGWLRTSSVTLPSATAATPVVSSVQYTAEGQRSVMSLGNGSTSSYLYEPTTGNLLQLQTTRISDARILQQIGYTQDAVGNVTRIEDASIPDVFCDQSQVIALQDYSYDALYQLITATGRENPAITQSTYKDGFKQSVYMPLCPTVTDVKLVAYADSYSYDLSGNMTVLSHAVPSQSSYSWTRTFTTSSTSNRTVLADMATPTTPPDSYYDANGNLISMNNLQAIGWNFRNSLASVTLIARENDQSDAEYYLYDAGGIRVRKVRQRVTAAGTVLEDKVYLGGYEVNRCFNGDSLSGTPVVDRQTLFVDGGQRILILHQWTATRSGTLPPPQFRFQYGTEQGSCALELDDSALVLSYEEYFPFGGTSIIAGNNQTEVKRKDYRYCGKECDDATGLYYYGARYYATWLGRWINCDPGGPLDGPNLYSFVANNPMSSEDSQGLCKKKGASSAMSDNDAPPDDDDDDSAMAISTDGSGKVGTSEQASYTLDDAAALFRELNDTEITGMRALVQTLHDAVGSATHSDTLLPVYSNQVRRVFRDLAPLNYGFNAELNPLWEQANLGDDTTRRYTYLRKGMTPLLQEELPETYDAGFYRKPEIHHATYQSVVKAWENTPQNLYLVTRGGHLIVGQHDALHLISSAGYGSPWKILVPSIRAVIEDETGMNPLAKGSTPEYLFAPRQTQLTDDRVKLGNVVKLEQSAIKLADSGQLPTANWTFRMTY